MKFNKQSEKLLALLRSKKEKDRNKALRVCYEAFDRVAKALIQKGASPSEAKDIFQEAVFILYKKTLKSDFELTASPLTYLFSTSTNLWQNKLRRKNTEQQYVDSFEANNSLETENPYQTPEAKNILRNILSKLGTPCRELLQDYYVRSLSMAEIAQKFGYSSINTAKTRKYKCLQQAKRLAKEKINISVLF